jgi:proline iminopeptidase
VRRMLIVCELLFAFLSVGPPAIAQTGAATSHADSYEGFVVTPDGVRLYFHKIGAGKHIVLIPAELFLYPAFARLAPGRTLIFYDMRDRGRSDAVADPQRITIQDDVDDLETIRKHFGADKPALIGWSYLGMMVMSYAIEHPNHVSRIVQLGPVSRKFGEVFPPALTANDRSQIPDPGQMRQLEELEKNGYIHEHPKEFCEKEWQVSRVQLVGDPANAAKLGPSKCDLPNEWPSHLYPHFEASISSIRALDIPVERLKTLRVPVLTIHGTKDRNAPYGGGRQWSMLLPDSRLVSIPGAAHMSWVEAPELVFSSIDTFLNGDWPASSEKVNALEPALKM